MTKLKESEIFLEVKDLITFFFTEEGLGGKNKTGKLMDIIIYLLFFSAISC